MRMIALIMRRFVRFKARLLVLLLPIVCTCIFQPIQAQIPDSSQHAASSDKTAADLNLPTSEYPKPLPELIIRDVRFDRTGYSNWKPGLLPAHGLLSLSDRLSLANALDVRANAPGTLATLSVRGSGPNHTPIFWNGLNLQSPMNGVMDAALVSIWPDDQLEIQFGGQSATRSSGAMGGSVVITPGQQRFEEGFSGFVSGVAGSFGHWEGSGAAGFSDKKWASKIRASWQQADNDFGYLKQGLNGQYYRARQVNNFLRKTDLQQFNQLKINKKNLLKTAFWFQDVFRELPPSATESPRETWQKDRAHRAILTWEHTSRLHSLWTTRVAWLDDFLAFHLESDTDTSRSRQILLSTERSATLGKHLAWRVGGNGIRQWAQVDGYSDSTRWYAQTRLASYAMAEWRQSNALFSALVRQEWAEAQSAPFTWSLGGQVGLGRLGEARFHLSRNFNLPTLNDRFWKNLGNPDLRPEKGYSTDLAWGLKRSGFSFDWSVFNLILDDWILWQPDSTGLFRPENVRKVWSRGMETVVNWQVMGLPTEDSPLALRQPSAKADTSTEIKAQDRKSRETSINTWNIKLSGRLQISKTTNVAVYTGSESALGKQLPYTPRISAGLSLVISRGIITAAYLHQFTGTRFDNNENTVDGYTVGNLLASCSLWKRRVSIDLRLENIWNTRYEIIRYRPMPGWGWRLGLRYKW